MRHYPTEPAEVDSAALFGLIMVMTWGIWVVMGNATSESIDLRIAAVASYLVAALLTLGFIVVSDALLIVTVRGGLLVGVAGLCINVSLISMYISSTRGSTTIISTLGAIYFVVTAVIGVVALGGNLTVTKLTGITFVALDIVLITR